MTRKQMKAAREKAGLTRLELAQAINETVLKEVLSPISERTIEAMEYGERKIQPYVVNYFKNNC